jgi:hypothetical protein
VERNKKKVIIIIGTGGSMIPEIGGLGEETKTSCYFTKSNTCPTLVLT